MFSSVKGSTGFFWVCGSKGKLSKLNVFIVMVSLFSVAGRSRGQPTGADPKDLDKTGYLYGKLVTSMVPIRDRQQTSICHYEVVSDVNVQRIPSKIDKVLCRKELCECSEQEEFRCTQLYTQLNVTYLSEDFKLATDFEMVAVEYACVCSKAPSSTNINLLEPFVL